MQPRVMYVELKSGYSDDGPAWIGRVQFSKSGRSIYYRGLTLKAHPVRGNPGNYYDEATGDEYWVSGVKRNGQDRHSAGRGAVEIDDDAREEYERIIGG